MARSAQAFFTFPRLKKALFTMATLSLLLAGMIVVTPSYSQDATDTDHIESMGLPKNTIFSMGGLATYDNSLPGDREWGGQLFGRVHHYLKNAMFGMGVAGELYLGTLDGESDAGVRLFGVVKAMYSSFGADYSERLESWDFIWSLDIPLKRGGLFGIGDTFRIDWIPGRGDTFNFGISIPIGQPWQGKTRTKDDRVTVPSRPWKFASETSDDPELEQTLVAASHAADWVNIYTTPFFDQKLEQGDEALDAFNGKIQRMKAHMDTVDAGYPDGHTVAAEIAAYHALMQQAFALAIGVAADSGRAVATYDRFREVLVETVLLPYDRLIGLSKRGDNLLGLGGDSAEQFSAWLLEQGFTSSQHDQAMFVHNRAIRFMDEIRQGALKTWSSSQFVWLPLHWGYKPDEVDDRDEFDELLQRVTGDTFTAGNRTWYIINEEFHSQVAQGIVEAEDYHVLWIHDFSGLNHLGEPDLIAAAFAARVYMPALIKSVERYDETGKLVLYMMLLSQWFYQASHSWLYTQFLQDPMRFELDLPDGYEKWEQEFVARQEDLRRAVANSKTLQKQRAMFGDDWLYNRVKVHVNVTNRNDWTFRTTKIIPNLFFLPDNLIVDHRKLAFWDVSEDDPDKGAGVFSGMGIGQHYTGPSWEDRGVLIEGPALLDLRNELIYALKQQGFSDSEIPGPLRPRPFAPDYHEKVGQMEQARWATRVMGAHNLTGFESKPIAAMKATFYSMMPAGTTMIVPDSLWNASFWGGMLAGAALRGCTVMPITPSIENAPSGGFPQMTRAFELFARFILIRDQMADEIASAGGMLRPGVYNRQTDVGNTPEKVREFMKGVEKYPFLKEVFPFPDSMYDEMLSTADALIAEGWKPVYFTEDIADRRPKMHLKINYFASPQLDSLLRADGWDRVMAAYLRARTDFTGRDEMVIDIRKMDTELGDEAYNFLVAFVATLPPEDVKHYLSYLTVGSHNQDDRGIITDGEIAWVITRASSLGGMVDMFFISGLTDWVTTVDELQVLIPPAEGWRVNFSRFMTKAL